MQYASRIPEPLSVYALKAAPDASALRVASGAARRSATASTGSTPARSFATWVVREMDRTAPEAAAAMHDCFEAIDTVPLLPRVKAPVLLLSGDKSAIASAQQQIFVESLPNGRVEAIPGVGHGVNLLQPERCARLAAAFWDSLV